MKEGVVTAESAAREICQRGDKGAKTGKRNYLRKIDSFIGEPISGIRVYSRETQKKGETRIPVDVRK